MLLCAAIRAGDVPSLERMLSEGVSVDSTAAVEAEDGFPSEYLGQAVTALMLAIGLRRNRIARLLLERGANVRAFRCLGETALHTGAAFGNVEMIRVLIAAGNDIHAADDNGATPILYGERKGDVNKRLVPYYHQ